MHEDMQISIHAPSRERPMSHYEENCAYVISIHAPSRERQERFAIIYEAFEFQSTLPRGSDY